jgi:hypothetical protein
MGLSSSSTDSAVPAWQCCTSMAAWQHAWSAARRKQAGQAPARWFETAQPCLADCGPGSPGVSRSCMIPPAAMAPVAAGTNSTSSDSRSRRWMEGHGDDGELRRRTGRRRALQAHARSTLRAHSCLCLTQLCASIHPVHDPVCFSTQAITSRQGPSDKQTILYVGTRLLKEGSQC